MEDSAENNDVLEQFYIEIGNEARNWYLRVPQPDASYQADIGLLTGDGKFFLLSSSNR